MRIWVVGADDDWRDCLFVLLFENPYSPKAPVTVHGRSNSAKLADRLWHYYFVELRQWHYLTYSQLPELKCHKEPLNAKLVNSPANHLFFFTEQIYYFLHRLNNGRYFEEGGTRFYKSEIKIFFKAIDYKELRRPFNLLDMKTICKEPARL
ncbi:hypothetical protein R2R35_17410 [Anaerocolumna sp. AGMB13020]|uniref:hypothetical protein n=1 Tax=Anaerocolumna sp. AGMB13020 TaxID=3081750 RepID=UPI0029549B7B|nr:hypothetical protein [Anaerocolumna sp. AGMB13020]WOO35563.1 hypothetical protein R2R35_17410 [Anaerocolumna sp. AGMB13020]